MGSKRSAKELWTLIQTAASAWIADYAPSMGAALSYYTVFSLAPLLLIVVSVAGLVFGQDAARGALFEQLRAMMGADAAGAVEGLLASVSRPTEGAVGTAIGVVVLLVGATTVFGELQDALDRIWRAPARPGGSGLWALLRTRFLSFGMILGIAFLLMVSLVVSTAVAALGKWWSPVFGGWEVVAQVLTFVFGFGLTTLVFAMIYKLMPRADVRWHDVWIGAAVTSLLFSVGRFLISLYIGKSSVASGFGAAGSLIIVFVWVYYSAQIFLVGAEFTWVYARTFGSMKGLAAAAAAPAAPVPQRGAGGAALAPAGAQTGMSPALPLPTTATQAAGTAAPSRNAWSNLGIGIVIGLSLRALTARVLRRTLAKRSPLNAGR